MNHRTNLIADALAKALRGEAAPSFTAPEFEELVTAIVATMEPVADPFACRAIGLRAMHLLLEHLQASMRAQRELAILRDGARPC